MATLTPDIIEIFQGDYQIINIEINDENGDDLDLTGKTIRLTVKEDHDEDDEDALIELTTDNGGIALVAATLGTCQAYVLATHTRSLTAKNYVYDLKVIDGNNPYTVSHGIFTIIPSVFKNES
jgi:hypothetical protein